VDGQLSAFSGPVQSAGHPYPHGNPHAHGDGDPDAVADRDTHIYGD